MAKYSTVAEIDAAIQAVREKIDTLKIEVVAAMEPLNAIDLKAADADAQYKSIVDSKVRPTYTTQINVFDREINPEVIEIVKSINNLSNKFGFNSERDRLLVEGTTLNRLHDIAQSLVKDMVTDAKTIREEINRNKAGAAAEPNTESPAATADAPTSSDTAANSVVNNSAPTANQASTPAPASPAPSVPENQLNTTQRTNLVKSQLGDSAAQDSRAIERASDSASPTANEADAGTISIAAPQVEVTPEPRPRPNPLHQYPSYTYGLSLHLLTASDYNTIVETGEYSAKNVLVASAGRYTADSAGKTSFVRNKEFSDDFYFENLNLLTIIGVGERTRATNAIEIKFTLVEPYGLTFLDRLLAASKSLGIENYLQNPYMLQIDFYGADDEGNILHPIPNLTKNIPIRMLSCSASVNTKGSEYQIQAVPFNHQAFDHIVVETPINIEVTASTVAGFFKSSTAGTDNLAEEINKDNKERTEASVTRAPDGTFVPTPLALISAKYTQDPTYKTNSFGDALNAYVKQVELNHKQVYSDRYEFLFDEEIGSANIVDNMAAPSEVPMSDLTDLSNAIRSSAGLNTASFDKTQVVTPINYGTSIEAVLARVIRNSSYIRKQLTVLDNQTNETEYNNSKRANENKPLKWFKVIPSVKLIGFDPFTNMFARLITYHVVPYEIRNVRLDDAPQAKAKHPTKLYNYMYTGENDDILDLKIEFNSMYYTAITAYRSNNMFITGKDSYLDNVKGSCDVAAPPIRTTIQPTQRRYRLTDQRDVAASRAKSAQEIAAADLDRSLTVEATADMLSVQLKILGDPEFIKQDDLFYSPKIDNKGNIIREAGILTKNNSIRTDTGEIYARLIIKTPTDVDDSTGMMSFGEKNRTSGFSGLYRIFQVENDFSQGKFTQMLTIIRQPDQEAIENQRLDSAKAREETAHWSSSRIANEPQPAPDAPTQDVAQDDTTNLPATIPETVPDQQPDANADDLANIRENASELPITDATEPQLLPQPPVPSGQLDALSFPQAFKQARAAYGGQPGGVFTWRGKEYQTNIVSEAYVANPVQVYQ